MMPLVCYSLQAILPSAAALLQCVAQAPADTNSSMFETWLDLLQDSAAVLQKFMANANTIKFNLIALAKAEQ